jgi:hypothetical protein
MSRHVVLLVLAVTLGLGCEDKAPTEPPTEPPPTTGRLTVTTTTTGTFPDSDGYALSLDGDAGQAIGSDTSLTLSGIEAGQHTVAVSDLAPNCAVDGENPRTVAVTAGAASSVTFEIVCETPPLRWQAVESGTNFDLSGVWGASGEDVFTVGESPDVLESGIFHYDGQSWTSQRTEPDVALQSVWGSAADDVFAVGFSRFGVRTLDGVLLHYDGGTWSTLTGLGLGDEVTGIEVFYKSVWGTSGSDVFAVGHWFSDVEHGLVAHYDGAAWSRMTIPDEVGRVLEDAHGTSSQDVFAVGGIDFPEEPTVGVILHFDGTQWTETLIEQEGLALRGVWSNSPTDVFAVGDVFDSETFTISGTILHYDGQSWSAVSIPSTGRLLDVWGASGTDIYAVGDAILHYDGTAWTEVSPEGGSDVWGSSAIDVFVVGLGGAILHGTP